jgi:signal transduction histidine kinase
MSGATGARPPAGTRRDVAPERLAVMLKEHSTLGGVPSEELAWMAAHGFARHFETGELLAANGEPIEGLHVVFSGHFAIYVDRGEGRHKVLEWRGGDVAGMLPYSRMKASPGDVIAVEPTEALTVLREHFPELISRCPHITAILVHTMVDRARLFTSSDLHDEKMKSLGKLAAGLAHELNNPASAVVRSAELLIEELAGEEAASRKLESTGLTPVQHAALDAVRDACTAARAAGPRTTLEEADRSDAFSDWLENHGADAALAGPLADTAVTLAALDQLADDLPREILETALQWVAHGCAVRSMAREIQSAASRIHELVAAVKGFTHMDVETTPRSVDVGQGLADTMTVLRSKVKAKSARVDLVVEPGLPPVMAYGGELNQVWVNLIDNALDAAGVGGRVEVSARRGDGKLVVRVTDNGPGIPASVRQRIFDPFFTTKPVGEGTGLGLDITRRLVNRHNGTIEVDSRPGHTVFTVSLPLGKAP